MLKRWRFLLILTVMFSAMTDAEVLVRTELSAKEFWIGQRVSLKIEVLGDEEWATISKMEAFEVQGAYVLPKESQGTRLSETIDGKSYRGQSYEISVFPQVNGEIVIPPITLEVVTRKWGSDSSKSVTQIKTPVTSFISKIPPGVEDVAGLITTSSLNANQNWEPETQDFKVGDALQRTITLQADDITGMAFTPLVYDELAGVGIYLSESRVEDTENRGTLTGQRTESVTYVFERAGIVEISDVVLTWWNATEEKLEKIILTGRQAIVLPGEIDSVDVNRTGADSRFKDWTLWLSSVAIMMTILYLRFRAQISQKITTWCKHRMESEERYFKRALTSIRSKKANLALRDIMRWIDRINNTNEPAQLQALLYRYAVPDEVAAVEQLLHGVETGKPLQGSEHLIKLFRNVRKQYQQTSKPEGKAQFVLPELNNEKLS